MNTESVICFKCGSKFSKRRGNFQSNYGESYKGLGYLHICKNCIDSMYETYFNQVKDQKKAVRQVCRKLDLFWNESVYNLTSLKSSSRSIMSRYITKINSLNYAGKSYDDTLIAEGSLWRFTDEDISMQGESEAGDLLTSTASQTPEDIVTFWGSGYSDDMYRELEQRRQYWMSRFPKGVELDVGTEALIRQICSLELDINRDRFAGKPIDKSVNALNNLLGSANLKPTQLKNEPDNAYDKTPYGVWIRKLETQRPVSETSEELKDVDGIVRYISIWFLGHLCKMLGIKNTYCKLYEEEIEKMRVEHPEYEDEDDETMFNDIFESNDDSGVNV